LIQAFCLLVHFPFLTSNDHRNILRGVGGRASLIPPLVYRLSNGVEGVLLAWDRGSDAFAPWQSVVRHDQNWFH